ncbi:putative lon protease-like protein 2, peroxisomal isoform X2 [Iris pallida]|uniref:Lon protease-like protein 2, peroxisomal isoform X2 n=1 Tax=Iris pallida TaxID=29817 RepID=A0AAX6E1S4_IRIPA|nr:putative lon protease-like protein 2, peroxisomal isoform X2 [Iris pallida]
MLFCSQVLKCEIGGARVMAEGEKGLIGVLPVRDTDDAAMGSLLSLGVGADFGERSLKPTVDTLGDSQKLDGKNQQELIHWHNRLQRCVHPYILDVDSFGGVDEAKGSYILTVFEGAIKKETLRCVFTCIWIYF